MPMNGNEASEPATSPALGTESFSYPDGDELLSVTVQQLDDGVLVSHVTGELDLLTGPLLHDHLTRLLATQPQHLTIDLSQVSFLGSTGLTVLLDARRTAARQNTTLHLAGTTRRAVAMPLKITGLDRLFEIVPD